MVIRKLYKIESAHIVRGCSTDRCKYNYHGHSGKIEVFLKSNGLDNAGMVIDFGKLKNVIGQFIDMFDHAIHLYNKDKPENINFFVRENERVIILPFNPTAENYAIFFKDSINALLGYIPMDNGEQQVYCSGVRYHETDTGYAESDMDDPEYMWINETKISSKCFNETMRELWLKNCPWRVLTEETQNADM